MIEIYNTVVVPGFVAYPYLDDPFDDIDNQDKYLLHNYNNSPDAGFSFIFNRVNNYYSQFCKYVPFIHGSTIGAQLFHSYNQQLYISIFNIINSYDKQKDTIWNNINYLKYFYDLFPTHVNKFHLFNGIVESIKSAIPCLICHLTWIRCCFPTIKSHIQYIIGKLTCISCYSGKLKLSLESYVTELNSRTKCYIERLITSITCVIPNVGRNLYIQNLNVKLKIHKKELISFIESKIELLENIMKDIDNFCRIESDIGTLCNSICSDICKLRGILCDLDKPSIKNEIDLLESLVDKYLISLNDIYSKINLLLGSGSVLCDTCGLVYKISQIKPSIESKISCFKYSVEIDIRGIGINMSCESQPLMLDIKCEVPSLSDVRCWSGRLRLSLCQIAKGKELIVLRLRGIKRFFYYRLNNVRYVKRVIRKPELIIESYLENSIKSNVFSLKNSDNLFSNPKRIVDWNNITRSNLSTESISNFKGYSYSHVYSIISNMAIVESKFVLSKLYGCTLDTNKMLYILSNAEGCSCVLSYKWEMDNLHRMYNMFDNYPFVYSNTHKKFHIKSLIKTETNNLCLCLVIKFRLYPSIVKSLCRLIDIDFDILSTAGRNFDKYTNSARYKTDVSKSLFLVISLFKKITYSMYDRYLCTCNINPCECITKYEPKGYKEENWRFISSEITKWFMLLYETAHITSSSILGPFMVYRTSIFCKKPNDPYYQFYIAIIMFTCQLIENIFDEDETAGDSIQSLSALKAELELVKCDKRDGGTSSCDVYSTSVYIKICCNQVSSRLFYPDGKCNFVFEPMKWDNVFRETCCCSNSGCPRTNSSPCCCQGQKPGICCMCPQGTSGSCSEECVCKNATCVTIKFIINYGISKSEDQYCKEWDNIPNIWCLNKINECIGSDVGDCGCGQAAKCIKVKIYCQFKWLLHKYHDMFINEFFNVQINGLLSDLSDSSKRKGFVRLLYVSNNQRIIRTTKNNRIVDSTNAIKKNKLEGGSNNNYSYNDAYRINTSRAHGSLKYIIIKIVLILIIVVMTIFIRVKIETDDEYKMDNLLSEENGYD